VATLIKNKKRSKKMNALIIDNKEYAVVEKSIFLQMQQTIEDYEDSKSIAQTFKDVENGDDEWLSLEFIEKLLFSGESKVKLWREYRGLSAKELAAKTNIDPGAISRIESGKREPTLAQIKTLAEVLGVDVDDLI
jgi:DNA-binding XRE family transcriptional regulator